MIRNRNKFKSDTAYQYYYWYQEVRKNGMIPRGWSKINPAWKSSIYVAAMRSYEMSSMTPLDINVNFALARLKKELGEL